jgi:hypothetical protein
MLAASAADETPCADSVAPVNPILQEMIAAGRLAPSEQETVEALDPGRQAQFVRRVKSGLSPAEAITSVKHGGRRSGWAITPTVGPEEFRQAKAQADEALGSLMEALAELGMLAVYRSSFEALAAKVDAALGPTAPVAAADDEAAPPRKCKGGRPKSAVKGSDAKVIAALNLHHGYEGGGCLSNREPAENRLLAAVFGLSENALSRFLKDKFGKGGHKKYVAACLDGKIGFILADWNRDLTQKLANLRTEKLGRRD